jgi:hypothetical protein
MQVIDTKRCMAMLTSWADAAERYWVDLPDGLGYYGTGYSGHWAVQTNQKFVAAMAVLGAATGDERATRWALAALRFSLASHATSGGKCSDGATWGHSWISPLGIERMMFGVRALDPNLTDADRAALRRVLTSEADWQMNEHVRGPHKGLHANKWNDTGKNNPESNLWVGALLWRTAAMYPEHTHAAAWRDAAERYLFNSVSVESDAGHRLYVGANFFANYALDHHGYMNVGYMAICTSNAALLHFDLKSLQLARPEHLDHHQADLWRVLRLMTFDDGRLARIGGDSRLRYTYCQEFLLPSLLYAADRLGDADALQLTDRQLDLIDTEMRHAGDGSFYGGRLAELAAASPYYYTRLESDRACALASVVAYAPLVTAETPAAEPRTERLMTAWIESEYGAAVHRSATRFASFAWRAHGLAQGMCLPPQRSDLAEWSHNLAGIVRFMGVPTRERRLLRHHVAQFEGGFVTIGSIIEGAKLVIPEGMEMSDTAVHHLCFAALPDGHTVVGLQLCRVLDKRAYAIEIKGLQLNVPNDLYNGFVRHVTTASGSAEHHAPPPRDQALSLGSRWACVDHTIGVVGLYGGESLVLDRAARRRGGPYASLYVDELCWPLHRGAVAAEPCAVVLDAGWRVMSNVDDAATAAMAADAHFTAASPDDDTRTVTLAGCDGRHYRVTARFDACEAAVELLG